MPWTSTVVPIQRIPKYTQHIQRFKKIQFLDIHVSKANTELPPIFYENKIYVSKAIDTWNMSFKDIYCFHLCFYLCWWSQELENIKSNLKKSNSSDINTFFNAHLELSSKKIPENTREVFFMKFEGNAYIPKEAEQKFKNLDMLFGDFFSENQVFFNIYQKCRMEMCDLVPNAINLRKSQYFYELQHRSGVASIEKLIRRFVKNFVILSLGEARTNSQWLQPLEQRYPKKILPFRAQEIPWSYNSANPVNTYALKGVFFCLHLIQWLKPLAINRCRSAAKKKTNAIY